MRVAKEVTKAIDDFEDGDAESSMAHACMAVDGSARLAYPKLGVGARFTKFIRDHAEVVERMGLTGLDVHGSRFAVDRRIRTTLDDGPDVADLIYGVHRCAHGHGDAVPDNFELLPSGDGEWLMRVGIVDGSVRLPETVIWSLLGVVLLAESNAGQAHVASSYHLYWDPPRDSQADRLVMPINDWWGRERDFLLVALRHPRSFIRVMPQSPWYVTVEPGSSGISITELS